jgi:single-strand DNA-binding protein
VKTITIAGKLGRDAETRQAGQDTVTSFSVAVDERGRNGEKTTHWFDVSIWGKRGQALGPHLTKGSAVCVVGDFGTRTYQAKDGTTKTSLTVRCSEITLLGGKSNSERSEPQRQSLSGQRHDRDQDSGFGGDDFDDSSIPF